MAGLRVRQLVPSQVALVTPSQRTRNQPTRRPDASSIIRSRKYEIPGTATHETSTAGRHHPLPRCEHSSLDRRGGTGPRTHSHRAAVRARARLQRHGPRSETREAALSGELRAGRPRVQRPHHRLHEVQSRVDNEVVYRSAHPAAGRAGTTRSARADQAYLPDYPGEGADKVSIHNLLNHTSGIENFDRIKSYEEAVRIGIESYQLPHTTDELLTKYASGRLVGDVGKKFDYNNGDYIILGKIVEKLYGKTFDEVLDERILHPLGMTQSGMLYQQEIVPNLAHTYYKPGDASPLINDLPVYIQNWYSAGGMYSTAVDLATFADALYGSSKLLTRQTLDRMLTPGLDDYGYGVWVKDVDVRGKRHRVAQRPGSIMGADTLLLRFLDDDLTVVILSNTNATDIDAFGLLVGSAALY
jgi:D-alanyl-D-alanine carboxypeptidase